MNPRNREWRGAYKDARRAGFSVREARAVAVVWLHRMSVGSSHFVIGDAVAFCREVDPRVSTEEVLAFVGVTSRLHLHFFPKGAKAH